MNCFNFHDCIRMYSLMWFLSSVTKWVTVSWFRYRHGSQLSLYQDLAPDLNKLWQTLGQTWDLEWICITPLRLMFNIVQQIPWAPGMKANRSRSQRGSKVVSQAPKRVRSIVLLRFLLGDITQYIALSYFHLFSHNSELEDMELSFNRFQYVSICFNVTLCSTP